MAGAPNNILIEVVCFSYSLRDVLLARRSTLGALFLELFSLVQIIIPVVLSDTSVASATLS
jgi:hypothetical protein